LSLCQRWFQQVFVFFVLTSGSGFVLMFWPSAIDAAFKLDIAPEPIAPPRVAGMKGVLAHQTD